MGGPESARHIPHYPELLVEVDRDFVLMRGPSADCDIRPLESGSRIWVLVFTHHTPPGHIPVTLEPPTDGKSSKVWYVPAPDVVTEKLHGLDEIINSTNGLMGPRRSPTIKSRLAVGGGIIQRSHDISQLVTEAKRRGVHETWVPVLERVDIYLNKLVDSPVFNPFWDL